jgi:hypothetical protein
MKLQDKMTDDDIQVLGQARRKRFPWRDSLLVLAVLVGAWFLYRHFKPAEPAGQAAESIAVPVDNPAPTASSTTVRSWLDIAADTVNDVPLTILTPHHLVPELTLTRPAETDNTCYVVVQAADIGQGDYGIVGDYVLRGQQLAHGVRKQGYCAIIGGNLSIGMGADTPLLGQAISEKGYFFRQYPLVSNGQAIDNRPKGKSVRRALGIRNGEVAMAISGERESFHDFAQALADAGFSDAIYLVGSDGAYCRYRGDGKPTVAAQESAPDPESGTNYLVWRSRL